MIDKQKEFTGILKDYDEDTVTITLADETEKTFDKGDIALIRLAPDRNPHLLHTGVFQPSDYNAKAAVSPAGNYFYCVNLWLC